MNYTTLAEVKAALGAVGATDDQLLARKIEEASRIWDKTECKAFDDYFKLETVTNETINGIIGRDGVCVCWPKKSIVNSVSAFAYRTDPRNEWTSVDAEAVVIKATRMVSAYGLGASGPCFVKLTYSGGYGTETWSSGETPVATITGLPRDIIDAVTVLAVRLYKEEKGGLADTIGVAETGERSYTKAMPVRVDKIANAYKRTVA